MTDFMKEKITPKHTISLKGEINKTTTDTYTIKYNYNGLIHLKRYRLKYGKRLVNTHPYQDKGRIFRDIDRNSDNLNLRINEDDLSDVVEVLEEADTGTTYIQPTYNEYQKLKALMKFMTSLVILMGMMILVRVAGGVLTETIKLQVISISTFVMTAAFLIMIVSISLFIIRDIFIRLFRHFYKGKTTGVVTDTFMLNTTRIDTNTANIDKMINIYGCIVECMINKRKYKIMWCPFRFTPYKKGQAVTVTYNSHITDFTIV